MNVLEIFAGIFLIFGAVVGMAYFFPIFVNMIPSGNTQTTVNTVTTNITHSADNSIVFFIFAIIALDLIVSFLYPNKAMAMLNFLLLFSLGVVNELGQSILTPLITAFSANTNLPLTTGFISGNNGFTLMLVLGFSSIVGIIFNLRHRGYGDEQVGNVE